MQDNLGVVAEVRTMWLQSLTRTIAIALLSLFTDSSVSPGHHEIHDQSQGTDVHHSSDELLPSPSSSVPSSTP